MLVVGLVRLAVGVTHFLSRSGSCDWLIDENPFFYAMWRTWDGRLERRMGKWKMRNFADRRFFRDWEGTGISVKQSWKMMEKGSTYKGQWIEMSRWEWIEGNSYVSNKKTKHIIVKPAALIILGTLDQFFYVIKGKHHTNFAPKLEG